MSEQQPPPPQQPAGLTHPQILVAVIGAITTVIVTAIGVIPSIISSTQPPTPTPTPIIITATPIPPSETPIVVVMTAIPPSETRVPTEITVVSSSAATSLPETPTPLPVIPLPTTASAPPVNTQNMPPNVRLMYDSVSFTLLNESGGVLSLEGVRFRGGNREWEARNWGPSIHNSIPNRKCVRLRDAAAGQRQPPAPCQNNIYGLIEVGTVAFFWRDVTTFEVMKNGAVIATCATADGECRVYIEG